MGTFPGGILIKPTTTVDTSAYSAGDLMFDKVELKNAVNSRGGASKLISINAYHEAPAAAEDFTVLFFDNSTSLGAAANAAATDISDAEFKAAGFIGLVSIDGGLNGEGVGNGRAYTASGSNDRNLGLPLLIQAADGKTSIWVAVIVKTDTPDFSSADTGWQMSFGFEFLG